MKSYSQFCPLAQATQLLCERWTLIIVRELIAGSTRFSELQKGAPQISPTLLSHRLKQLQKASVVEVTGTKGAFSYGLTVAGKELKPIVELLGVWGHRWAQSALADEDLDAGLLMWDMRRSVDPTAFPVDRVVIQFEYPDAPAGSKQWWLVSENGDIDLCLTDHGYDVDVIVRCSLKVMTSVWVCKQPFNHAVDKGEIMVMGNRKLTSRLQQWLSASALSRLGAMELTPTVDWGFAER